MKLIEYDKVCLNVETVMMITSLIEQVFAQMIVLAIIQRNISSINMRIL